MKKSNLIFILFVSLLVMQFGFIPKSFAATEESTKLSTSQIKPSSVRIAIYNEPNITQPAYSSHSTFTNNYSALIPILTTVGFSISELTTQDIYEHKLMTASYDIFIMADNCPKVNISNYVKEFWLGGGGLISFDSALPYLFWAGIIVPESEGDEGFATYYAYSTTTNNHNITLRHPITQDFQVTDIFETIDASINYVYWSVMSTTTYGSDLISLAIQEGYPDRTTMFALDPPDKGGKVVHLPGRTADLNAEMEDIFIEAINWVCPRPKGRILFDLSHGSYYGIDPWDVLADYPAYYEILRDNLVSRAYTVDKLYPSLVGNFTTNNLAPYDVVIVCFPNLNFTSNEVTAVTSWVNNGGGFVVIGDNSAFPAKLANINHLLSNFDLAMNLTNSGTNTVTYTFEHPTIEGCSQITALAPGLIVYGGDAYPIWGNNIDDIIVGGQDYGKGRVILMADTATIRDSSMASYDNLQFSVNMMNWLTADDAEVLIFVHNPGTPNPNDNIYRGPVATALNELGYSYYMTFTKEYLNLSLSTGTYKLVVIDNSEFPIMDTVGTTILNFLKAGGYMIISTYEYRLTSYNYLWDYIGFTYAGNYFTSPQSINIWNPTHSIFTSPVPYSDTTLETTLNFVNTDYTNLTLHSNATGIAGLTSTSQINGSAIIIGANKHVITNAMHLTEYYDDTDDDTYPDALQLWANEIAYMLTQINPPTTTPGIPGYDTFAVIFSIFFSISILSLVYIRKRKIHTN